MFWLIGDAGRPAWSATVTTTPLRSADFEELFVIDRVTATAGPDTSPARWATALTRLAVSTLALMPAPSCAAAVSGTGLAVVTTDDFTVWVMFPPLGAGTGVVRGGRVDSEAWVVSATGLDESGLDDGPEMGAATGVPSAAAADPEAAEEATDDTAGEDVEEQAESASTQASPIPASARAEMAVIFTMNFQTAGSGRPCRGTI